MIHLNIFQCFWMLVSHVYIVFFRFCLFNITTPIGAIGKKDPFLMTCSHGTGVFLNCMVNSPSKKALTRTELGGVIFFIYTPLKTNTVGWKITMFNKRYDISSSKWLFFHCHVSFYGVYENRFLFKTSERSTSRTLGTSCQKRLPGLVDSPHTPEN